MATIELLRIDGYVERRVDPGRGAPPRGNPEERSRELARARDREGVGIVGRLCTACLVGGWPMMAHHMARTRCYQCADLDERVTALAGLDQPTTAGRSGSRVIDPGAANDPEDATWDPVRAARRYQQERLTEVFEQAGALGVPVLELSDRSGRYLVRAVARDDIRRHDLIPAAMVDRVRRYARWLAALAPAEHALRADVLADVEGLAAELRRRERESTIRNARQRLGETVRGLTAAPRRLAGDVARLGRAMLPPVE